MNILLLDLGLELRGGQNQVYYLASTLQKKHIHAFVACPQKSPLASLCKKNNIPLIPLKGKSFSNPFLILQIEHALRKYDIKIIHTNDAHSATLGAFSKTLHKDNIILVHSRRVSYPLHQGVRMKKYMIADGIISVSEAIRKKIISLGIAPEKICTIHSCIDPALYKPKQKRNDGRFIFQSIGALTEQKGFNVLLRAMKILKEMENLPPWEVRIAGSGPLFENLLEEAFQLDVASNLALLGQQNSKEILPLADTLIIPSVNGEGSNATIKEGWATEIPVIASDLESNTELIQDHVNGLLTTVGDPVSLSAAMARCIKDPNLCKHLTVSGKEHLKNFTTTKMIEQHISFYNELIASNKPLHKYMDNAI